MIFSKEHIELIKSGKKWQTRRLSKSNETIESNPNIPTNVISWGKNSFRIKWQVGKTYAVQDKRGGKELFRIKITRIRKEQLSCISKDDIKAEGYDSIDFFYESFDKINKRNSLSCLNDFVWVIDFQKVVE